MEDVNTAVVPVTVTVPRGSEWYCGMETNGERVGQMGLWLRYDNADECKTAMQAMLAEPEAAAPAPLPGGLDGSSSLKGEDTHRATVKPVLDTPVMALLLDYLDGKVLTVPASEAPTLRDAATAIRGLAALVDEYRAGQEQMFRWTDEMQDLLTVRPAATPAASQVGIGPLADEPNVPTEQAEGAVLDKDQLKAIEHAAMDAGAYSWRRCRLAMVEDGKVVGYPVFSRADMAELARLHRDPDRPAPTPASVSPGTEGE